MTVFWILLAVILIVGVWAVNEYNFFVATKARIKASIQEIGNQLKRQAELIPNLESSAKGYLKHEKGIFKDLTDARRAVVSAVQSGDLQAMSEAGTQIASLLPQLRIAVEDNPELKGADVVTKLMDELRDTSDKIMYARRLVIDLTADYNVKLATFPSNLIANAFSFEEQPGLLTPEKGDHLALKEEEMKTPKVDL